MKTLKIILLELFYKQRKKKTSNSPYGVGVVDKAVVKADSS